MLIPAAEEQVSLPPVSTKLNLRAAEGHAEIQVSRFNAQRPGL